MKTEFNAVVLMCDSARGVYIPKNFIEMIAGVDSWTGISDDDKADIMAGPEGAHYWDAWEMVTNNASCVTDYGTYTLYQDGDLWALCTEKMTDEEKANFGFDND